MKITIKAKEGTEILTLEDTEIESKEPKDKAFGIREQGISVSIGSVTILVDTDELIRAGKALQPETFMM